MKNYNTNKILELVLGYRHSALLGYISHLIVEDRIALLENFYPSLQSELSSLNHWIRYQFQCYERWLYLDKCLGKGKGYIPPTHEDLNLEDYVLGMNEKNRLVWDFKELQHEFKILAEDKTVLDYGCGGCFYADIFASVAKKVYAMDKLDVIQFIKARITLPSNVELMCSYIEDDESFFDVIWISEVFHGDGASEIMRQMYEITQHCTTSTIIIINELLPNTSLSNLFDIQMRLHTKVGKLYHPDELIAVIRPHKVEFVKLFKYHYWIGMRI